MSSTRRMTMPISLPSSPLMTQTQGSQWMASSLSLFIASLTCSRRFRGACANPRIGLRSGCTSSSFMPKAWRTSWGGSEYPLLPVGLALKKCRHCCAGRLWLVETVEHVEKQPVIMYVYVVDQDG
eukprot:4776474-Pyramimonas_sp.AAC.1